MSYCFSDYYLSPSSTAITISLGNYSSLAIRCWGPRELPTKIEMMRRYMESIATVTAKPRPKATIYRSHVKPPQRRHGSRGQRPVAPQQAARRVHRRASPRPRTKLRFS